MCHNLSLTWNQYWMHSVEAYTDFQLNTLPPNCLRGWLLNTAHFSQLDPLEPWVTWTFGGKSGTLDVFLGCQPEISQRGAACLIRQNVICFNLAKFTHSTKHWWSATRSSVCDHFAPDDGGSMVMFCKVCSYSHGLSKWCVELKQPWSSSKSIGLDKPDAKCDTTTSNRDHYFSADVRWFCYRLNLFTSPWYLLFSTTCLQNNPTVKNETGIIKCPPLQQFEFSILIPVGQECMFWKTFPVWWSRSNMLDCSSSCRAENEPYQVSSMEKTHPLCQAVGWHKLAISSGYLWLIWQQDW